MAVFAAVKPRSDFSGARGARKRVRWGVRTELHKRALQWKRLRPILRPAKHVGCGSQTGMKEEKKKRSGGED